jgi:predicted glycogen debranching enzyme
MDGDGLLACGEPGVQLTWMDARVNGRVITPRIGKPVEVQALWINALRLAGRSGDADRATAAFRARFLPSGGGALLDVVDADHVPGRLDASVRPNQLFAIGGLPFGLIEGDAARAVLRAVEGELLTPAGLRSLAPSDPAYRGRYEGGPGQRDGAYHQGTVWPWLIGAFVDAWLRVNGNDAAARAEARTRFVDPLAALVGAAGIDHLFEIADGDAPHTPRGCPFQAWSLGELIRAQKMVE